MEANGKLPVIFHFFHHYCCCRLLVNYKRTRQQEQLSDIDSRGPLGANLFHFCLKTRMVGSSLHRPKSDVLQQSAQRNAIIITSTIIAPSCRLPAAPPEQTLEGESKPLLGSDYLLVRGEKGRGGGGGGGERARGYLHSPIVTAFRIQQQVT